MYSQSCIDSLKAFDYYNNYLKYHTYDIIRLVDGVKTLYEVNL